MSARTGIGTTITFATSSFTALVRNYNDLGVDRAILDTTHMGSSVAASTFNGNASGVFREKAPGKLFGVKDMSIDILFDPDTVPPVDENPEVITLQFLPDTGQSTGASFSFSGFISEISAAVPYDDLCTATITLAATGEPTWTAGAV